MATSKEETESGGLVKTLLFPRYTDAGSNESFRTTAADAQSEATTALHDNRSTQKLTEVSESNLFQHVLETAQQQQHQKEYAEEEEMEDVELRTDEYEVKAFHLPFQPIPEDIKSEANSNFSTASEMGTIIGLSQLNEVDQMADLSMPALADSTKSSNKPSAFRQTPSSALSLEATLRRYKAGGTTSTCNDRLDSVALAASAPTTPTPYDHPVASLPSSATPRSRGGGATDILRSFAGEGRGVTSAIRKTKSWGTSSPLSPRHSSSSRRWMRKTMQDGQSVYRLEPRETTKSPLFYNLRPSGSHAEASSTALTTQEEEISPRRRKFLKLNCFSWDTSMDHQVSEYPISTSGHAYTRRSNPHKTTALHASQSWDVTQTWAAIEMSPAQDRRSNLELRTPQRIEIERDDAIDILACLVERGIATEDANDTSTSNGGGESQPTNDEPSSQEEEKKEKSGKTAMTLYDPLESPELTAAIESLRHLSQGPQKDDSTPTTHEQRMKALEELMRSHSYALEMKRAARSASAWLRSIGRSEQNSQEESTPTQQAAGEEEEGRCDTPMSTERIDYLSVKAMLHSAQMQVQEKTELADRLNEELSNCRAEIGRLKSASRAEALFTSPNRSILDEQDESDDDGETLDRSASPILPEDEDAAGLDSSFQAAPEEPVSHAVPEGRDLIAMRSSLEAANAVICQLHAELIALKKQAEDGVPDSTESSPPPPIIEPPVLSASQAEEDNDNRLVHVRMLDSENFVTEWHDLTPPLPPPPDHDLRSPIVAAVLDQWTKDEGLHESLLSWMESIMMGVDLENIPPLTISSLDHQVRDGIAMHVIPLLLRRPDIHVDVQTRAHRRTFYDISVTVTPMISDEQSAHSGVAAHMRGVSTRPSGADFTQDELSEVSVGSSSHHPGLMSALGGALGGLLSRRKPQMIHAPPHHTAAQSPPRGAAAVTTITGEGTAYLKAPNMDPATSVQVQEMDEEQPYQRVVSAPPGKIGLTFVEFRGHAMCSDIAPNSPLAGWVFPSDILIAIDEVPVSGMRVRDIIKLLTSRKDRQRALRVISSHAMNEFTLNSSVISEHPHS